jgi:aminotransferase
MYDARRRWLHQQLRDMGLECELPAGAFYFWIAIDRFGVTSLEFAHGLLASQKVVLMPGENFGPSGSRHVRISYAASQAKLEEGCRRLRRFLALMEYVEPGTRRQVAKQFRVDDAHLVPDSHHQAVHSRVPRE